MRWRGVLIAVVVLGGVIPARAETVQLDLGASAPGGRSGQNIRVVALVTQGGVPVSGRAIGWQSHGAGFIVVSDEQTDAAGKARAIVRGWGDGEQVVEAWLGDPGSGCFGEDCASISLQWTLAVDRCRREGYGVEVTAGLVPLPPVRLGAIDGDGPCWEGWQDRNYAADIDAMFVNVAVAGASYDNLWNRVRANASSVFVFPFVIGVAEVRAAAKCFEIPHTVFEIGLVTIDNWLTGETIYAGIPSPGQTITLPGVGRVVLNERKSTDDERSSSGWITGARLTLDAGPVVRIAHASSSRTCEDFEWGPILSVAGDAHSDYPTGPAHLSIGATEDPFGGLPFLVTPVQYSDSRADPPGAPSQPFTCYSGTVATLTEEEPEYGRARARLTGSITCKNLQSGTATYSYELVVEDISPFLDPDWFDMTLRSGATTIYHWSDFTTGGWIDVGGV